MREVVWWVRVRGNVVWELWVSQGYWGWVYGWELVRMLCFRWEFGEAECTECICMFINFCRKRVLYFCRVYKIFLAKLEFYTVMFIKYRVLKTWFLLCRNRVLKTRDLCGHFNPISKFIASTKWISKTRFLIRSRVLETRDVSFLKYLKRCITYYIDAPHQSTLQIPSIF